ncbi:DUF222 domain-containing protein [Janibacter indicus]|uniref:HNH endonuclease n=1 Tax=Janibacter indicus TaxID=857417 RepID=UPI003D9A7F86
MTETTVRGSGECDASSEARLPDALAASLAALGAASVDGLGEAELLEVVALLESTKGAASALQARATERFVEQRDGLVSAAVAREELSDRQASLQRRAARSEVALARRVSPGQADRHVGVARALVHELPCTMAALTAGQISEWRATIVVRETACLAAADRLEADRRLSGCLTTLGDQGLSRAAHRVCADLDQAALVERRRRAAASRRVGVRPAPDGMAWLSVLGPVAEVVGAYAALRSAERSRHVATGDARVDAERAADGRGEGAWLADTALKLLSGRAEGQPQPVEVALVMSEAALLPGVAPASVAQTSVAPAGGEQVEVPGFGAMPPETAREMVLRLLDGADADDAASSGVWLRRLWTSPGGHELVAMDSTRRLFHGGLRRFVELRDQGCRVPWCDAPARQVDHVEAFARGGETSAANGLGVCQRHNLDKEQPGWSAEVLASGLDPGGGRPHEVVLSTSTGVVYRSLAPPPLGHGRGSIGQVSTGPVPAGPVTAGPVAVSHPDVLWSPLEVRLGELFAA